MKRLSEITDWHQLINEVVCGNCLAGLKLISDNSVDCCITSPPYWGLRDYGNPEQMGLEKTPEQYVADMVAVFMEVKRVLKKEGTLWLNLGDSYAGVGKGGQSEEKRSINRQPTYANKGIVPAGLKSKDLVGIPWRVAFALQASGWYLRQDIIWSKPNPMPESVTDRCTKAHEYIFLLTRNGRYYFNSDAIREDAVWDVDGEGTIKRKERQREGLKSNPTERKNGIRIVYPNGKHKDGQQPPKTISGTRNKRSVWEVTTKGYREAHFATFPHDLIEPMIAAGSPEGGLVLDPFMGAFTTARTSKDMGRSFIGFELSEKYCQIGEERLRQQNLF
jgi:DNA modification methylase